MILSLFNLFLITVEISNLLLRITISIGQQFIKPFVPQKKKSVDGQIIVITGGGSGVGRAIALRFAKLNAIIVLWDNNKESVEKTAKQIRKIGGTAHPFVIDVSDEKKVELTAELVRQQVGDVYMLINNAGVCPCLPFKQLTYSQIRRTFDVNILSQFWTLKQFLPVMEECGRGHIVAISSSAGIMGSPYFTAYGSSKYGVVGLMSSLAKELHELDNDSQIKLTTICPLGISGTNINIPTRTRFPRILPIMTLDFAVDQIVDGILKEDTFIVIPFTFKLIYLILRICPIKVSQLLFEYLDYAVEPPGSNAPIGRSHYNDRNNSNNTRNHH